jgi:hypothetical protein
METNEMNEDVLETTEHLWGDYNMLTDLHTFLVIISLSPLAMDVACLRPSAEARAASGGVRAPNTSFSNQQSLKLFGLLQKLYRVGGYSHTFGALDPVQAIQMAPHLSSVYVSGWQCSSTASTTNEPGPDVR